MIEFEGKAYQPKPDETVLDCLLRHDVEVSSFCRSGACQSCMLRAPSHSVPAVAQAGLKPSWKQQGFFLACVCRPSGDLTVERCDAAGSFDSTITRVERLTEDVLRIRLARPTGFDFRAGQFVQLIRADGLMRPYSIASLPEESELELHVARLPEGKMSGWLAQSLGTELTLRGPFGECFYQDEEPQRPLVLAGTGTGLAPLLGILRAAAARSHQGPITLFHGALTSAGLYLRAELEALANALPSLELVGSLLSGTDDELGAHGRWYLEKRELDQLVISRYPKLNAHRLYLCGNPDIVRRLRKRVYLAGASLDCIHSDSFAPPAPV
jgi:CDP-4-dehydro-6-deoxyglucose reductase